MRKNDIMTIGLKRMVRRQRLLVWGMLLMLFQSLTACNAPIEELKPQPTGGVEVCVAAPMPESRVELEPNGVVTRWTKDDSIALWASSDEQAPLQAKPFALWHFSEEYSTAYFTAVVDPMPQGAYRYYASHPKPESFEGSVGHYTIPSTQSGSSVMPHALMVAEPVEAGALTDKGEELSLSFRHKLHILRITIPEAKNLLGKPIKRLEITFPVAVAGEVVFDVARPDAPVTLSEGSRVLNLNFDEPVDAGDVVWAAIAPVDASGSMISFRAYSEDTESELISTMGKRFEEGHTTPIRLTIPSFRKLTRIAFTVGENHLGESLERITLSAPAGVTFPDGATTKSFVPNAENRYEYSYEGLFTDNLSGGLFTLSFESKSAIVKEQFTMPQLLLYGYNELPVMDVPYLYFEDFSTIKGYDDNGSGGRNLDSSGSVINDTFLLGGWTGNQTYGSGGKAVAIRTRRETVAEYRGRMDSPAIATIKPGVSARVKITFNYAFSTEQSDTELKMHFGYTTQQGGISGDDSIQNRTEVTATDRSGSMDNVNQSYSAVYSGFTSQHRLSFGLYSTYDFSNAFTSRNHWLYIDNIKISIAE